MVRQLLSESVGEVEGSGRDLNAVLFRKLSEGTEDNGVRPPVRIFCVPVEIRTRHFPKTSLKRYLLNQLRQYHVMNWFYILMVVFVHFRRWICIQVGVAAEMNRL
jgi:hypothetical protein